MSFALETTLAGTVYERIIQRARSTGYYVVLIFVWVDSPGISIKRVRGREKLGGHFVPRVDIVRRYKRGLVNLFAVYMNICDYWVILDNTEPPQKIVADGTSKPDPKILREKIMAGANESMDKLILERMEINEPLVIGRNGKIQNVSPFILAEERWGKAFVDQWRKEHKP